VESVSSGLRVEKAFLEGQVTKLEVEVSQRWGVIVLMVVVVYRLSGCGGGRGA
jgi:hypothetical protein